MLSRRALMTSGGAAVALAAIGYGVWPRLDGYDEEVARQRALPLSDPTMIDLVHMATLAANGHNTQPWLFHLDDTRVRIQPDLSRRTLVVDPDDHHLYVSLGCAAENLMIAGRANGRAADFAIENGAETTIDIALKAGPVDDEALYQAIPLRQSTRSAFDGQSLSAPDIRTLAAAAQMEGVSVKFYTEPSDLEAILDFVVAGNSAQMDDPNFVDELRDWLRFSPNDVLTTKDGLFSACSGNPVMPNWIGKPMFNMFFSKESENDKYRSHIRTSAGVAVFTGDKSDPEHWIKVGRSFQRFALQATTLGIRNAHINQPIEVPSIRPEFTRWLGADARPDLVVRFGRAPTLPMSLRRPADEVIV